jgi:hypothetical protein
MPPWTAPSVASTAVFVAIVLTLAVAFVAAVHASGRALDEPPARTRRLVGFAAVAMLAWLALTAALPASGVLARQGPPPPLVLFFVGCNVLAIVLAFSRVGARFAAGLPIAALVGVHGFRLPLELVLHRWYAEGAIPVQMTYEGHNFDIVTGVLAIALWLVARRRALPRSAVVGFEIVGLGLLVTVGTIAVLSAPLPLRRYTDGPPLVLALYFPYAWIVSVCVAGALFGHLVLLRRLLAR